jgi:hypothetical protein
VATYKDYAVSGVWFEGNVKGGEHLSHVMLHKVSKHNRILKGVKTEKRKLIELTDGNIIYTLKWNYKDGRWNWGALIGTELQEGQPTLITIPGNEINNELINLINMSIQPV